MIINDVKRIFRVAQKKDEAHKSIKVSNGNLIASYTLCIMNEEIILVILITCHLELVCLSSRRHALLFIDVSGSSM